MAILTGSLAASGSHGGWRAMAEYTVTESATSIAVTVTEIRLHAANASATWNYSAGSTQTLKVGSNTATNNDLSWYDGTEDQFWFTNSSLSTLRSYTFTYAKGHAATTKAIAFSIKLGSYWWLDLNYNEKSVQNTTSSTTLNVDVPALQSWTVTLDAQGGTGAAASLTKYYNESLALPEPSKEGYTFAGWAASEDPTTVVYQPGDPYTANAAASLVAVWTPIISAAYITRLFTERDDGRGLWDSGTDTHTSASDDGEYVYVRAWWRVEGADSATVSIGAKMAEDSAPTTYVWTGTTRTASKPGSGELYLEGVAEWVTSQTADVADQYTVTVDLSAGGKTDQKASIVSQAFFTIDFLAGGHGVAIGKPATQQLFDVGMETNFDHDASIGGDVAVTGGLAVGEDLTVGGDLTLGTTAAINALARHLGMAKTKGDSWTMNDYIVVGHLTNAKATMWVTVKFPFRVYGLSNTSTGVAVSGNIRVRQNNNYLFGTTSSTTKALSTFTISKTIYANGYLTLGIEGTAQGTGAINNDAVVVHFTSLTITLS